jgi:hypothetical protein
MYLQKRKEEMPKKQKVVGQNKGKAKGITVK